MTDDLYREICRNPEDDTVRLAYADWLDENGDPDRAEFIRVQDALGVWCGRGHPREVALLAAHPEWSRCPCEACEGGGILDQGCHCPACSGTGDLFLHRVLDPGLGPNAILEISRTVTFARGFPDSVSCTLAELGGRCPDCTDGRWRNGRDGCCRTCGDSQFVPTPWAREVVRRTPVTRFELAGKTPFSLADNLPPCRWLRCDGTSSPVMLPDYLFDEIPGNGPTVEYDHWGRFYATEQAARDALALAAGRRVRRNVYGEVTA